MLPPDHIPVCPIPKSTYTTFMDEGTIHYRGGHYRKALFCFDRALELKTASKPALVSRSQCYLKLGDAAAALRDAQLSMDISADEKEPFIDGLYQYAEALFCLGEFEKASIAYHRGFRVRRDREEFKIGVNKCQEAIRTAIGAREATQIEDLDVVLPAIERMEMELRGLQERCCVLDNEADVERRKLGLKRSKASRTRTRWVDREVLGVLHQDKDYLTKFLKRPDIAGNHQSGSDVLRGYAKEALNYLDIREQFWHMQNPMYARKKGLNFNNDMVIQYEKQEHERMEAARKVKMDAAEGSVLKHIQSIEHALKIGRAHDCMLECDRALRQIKDISPTLLPRKAEFTTEILHIKGMSQMKMRTFDAACGTFQEEYEIAHKSKMGETKSRALDYLGRSFAMKGSYNEAAEVWDTRLSLAKTSIEKAYLFHEIGRCYYETNKMDFAKVYGQQCLDEALKIDDFIWAMNATILLGQCEVKGKSFETAAELFEKAEDYAQKCGNKGNVQLLREGQHCIKIYLEKQATAATDKLEAKSETEDGRASGNEDDDDGDN